MHAIIGCSDANMLDFCYVWLRLLVKMHSSVLSYKLLLLVKQLVVILLPFVK